jgi:CheY-like chemotaxis protein
MASVLIVDDIKSLRQLMRLSLGQQHQVIEAADGLEAIGALQHHHPDVALLDVNMPGMNGLEVCRRVRADPELRDIGVIIVSANVVADDAYRAGADRFISKPFRPSALLAAVNDLVRARIVA